MAGIHATVSDLLVTVKSREIQRGMLAEMRGDTEFARRHLLAAAHLERVLADDYDRDGEPELAFRSRISAASCFWRAGEQGQAQEEFDSLLIHYPDREEEIRQVIGDLQTSTAP